MIDGSSRRQFLRTAGVVCSGGLIGGCVLGGDDGPVAGDLSIRNTDSEGHTVAISVDKTSDDDDGVPTGATTDTPEAEPIWERTDEYRVASDEHTVVSGFLEEAGAFFVQVRIEGGNRSAQGWIGLYDASGGSVAEDYLEVSIAEGDRLRLSAQVVGA